MCSNGDYYSNCPHCGETIYCCETDFMGFPRPECGDPDPLMVVCGECRAELFMSWEVTLVPVEEDDGDEWEVTLVPVEEDTDS